MGLSTTPVSVNKVIGGVVTSTSGRPVLRIPAVNTSQSTGQVQPQSQVRCGIVTRNVQKDVERNQAKEIPKSEFYLVSRLKILQPYTQDLAVLKCTKQNYRFEIQLASIYVIIINPFEPFVLSLTC